MNFTSDHLAAEITTAAAAVGGKGGGRGKGTIGRGGGRGRGTPAVDSDAPSPALTPPPRKQRLVYPTIAQAFGVDWAALGKRVPRLYCALQAR